jgi:hypothetical protein
MKEWTREEVERLITKKEMAQLCPRGLWNFMGNMTWDEAVKTFGLPSQVVLLAQTRLDLETANGLLTEWKLVASDTNDKLNLKFEEITRLRGALERIDKIDKDGDEEWVNADVESDSHWMERWAEQLNDCGKIAREALKERNHE